MAARDQLIDLFKRFYPTSISVPEQGAPSGSTSYQEKVSGSSESTSGESETTLAEGLTIPSTQSNDLSTEQYKVLDMTPIYPPRLPPDVVEKLAFEFANSIPENKFTVAELQGYFLTVKAQPFEAVRRAAAWVREIEEEKERTKLKTLKEKEEAKKRKTEVAKSDSSTPTEDDEKQPVEDWYPSMDHGDWMPYEPPVFPRGRGLYRGRRGRGNRR
jgi:mitochondrial chaperone BCS1